MDDGEKDLEWTVGMLRELRGVTKIMARIYHYVLRRYQKSKELGL